MHAGVARRAPASLDIVRCLLDARDLGTPLRERNGKPPDASALIEHAIAWMQSKPLDEEANRRIDGTWRRALEQHVSEMVVI
jgi:hypothetical protein